MALRLTDQDKVRWLTRTFGDVAQKKASDGTYRTSVPLLFDVAPEDEWESVFRMRRGLRHRTAVQVFEGVGSDETQSAVSLFNKIVHRPSFSRNGTLDVYRYNPKAGQTPDVIEMGRLYEVVHHDDPLHDHTSPQLIDFEVIEIDPYSLEVYRGPYDLMHMHLLADR